MYSHLHYHSFDQSVIFVQGWFKHTEWCSVYAYLFVSACMSMCLVGCVGCFLLYTVTFF